MDDPITSALGEPSRAIRASELATVLAAGLATAACGENGNGNGTLERAQGEWTGSAAAKGDRVGLRLILNDGESDAVSGELRFQDPDSFEWFFAGNVSGTLRMGALSLSTDTGASFQLTEKGKTLSGNGSLPGDSGTLSVTVTAQLS